MTHWKKLVNSVEIEKGVYQGSLDTGLPVVCAKTEHGELWISLFGGQVLSFIPKDGLERFWLSQNSKLDQSAPIRGGVPICWPWFGAREGGPNHGFARTASWKLDQVKVEITGTRITLVLSDELFRPSYWPEGYELQLDVEMGQQLTLTLTCHNCGLSPWSFSAALHSYFRVDNTTNTMICGAGTRYHDKLIGQTSIGQAQFAPVPPLDRIYTHPDDTIEIKVNQACSWKLEQQGHDASVIWHPGPKMPSDMIQMDADQMLCVETAALGAQQSGIILVPGEAYQLIQRIR